MVRKIRLDPDALHVQSFDVNAAELDPGTVHAHEGASGMSCTYNCTLDEPTCRGPACRTVPVLTCLC